MDEIKFGTDGFRAIIADKFTFNNVRRIAEALSYYLLKHKHKKLKNGVLIGYDCRFLSDKFARCVADILCSHGISVKLTETAVATPAVSAYIRENSLSCGIIITASHNPPSFNGIKIKNEFGASVEKSVTNEIEKIIKSGKTLKPRLKKGNLQLINITKSYEKFLKRYLDFNAIKKSKYHIVVDYMHGASSGVVENVLKSTPHKLTSIRNNRDILFGGVNPEPISINLDLLKQTVLNKKANLGIALDGDGDRIGAICADGKIITSHMAICLILLHLIEDRKFSGKIVKSLNTTTLVDKIASFYDLPLEIVPVGFKNIAKRMLNENILLGGEESGGIGFKDYMPERDGALSGLLLLEMMACRKSSINDIIKDMQKRFGKFLYMRRDLHVKLKKKLPNFNKINGVKVKNIDTYDGTKYNLMDESWLIIRASGTEPIVRIYAESNNQKSLKKLIDFGCSLL